MYIDEEAVLRLMELGFQKKKVEPGDFYKIKRQEWTVGGKVFPEQQPLIPKRVIDKGIWLPSIVYLWEWLEHNTDSLVVRHVKKNISVFYIEMLVNNTLIKAKAVVMSHAFFLAVLKVLLFRQGKSWGKRIC